MPKKFETLECSICKRRVDKEFAPKNAKIQKCTITYGCLGSLKKIGEKDVGQLQSSYEFGLENWRPRNQQFFNSTDLISDQLIPISSTHSRSFTIGIDSEILWIDPFVQTEKFDTLELSMLQLTNKSQIHTEYLFNVDAGGDGILLSGEDSSSVKKNLTLDLDSDIFVFLNGQQLIENSTAGFTTSLAEITLPQNSIRINVHVDPLSAITVIKRKKSDIAKRTLTFKSNQSLQGTRSGSWANVNEISLILMHNGNFIQKHYTLFTLENPNELGNDVRLQLNYSKTDGIKLTRQNFNSRILATADPSLTAPIIGLLAMKPFSIKDRNNNNYYNFFDLVNSSGFLKFFKAHDNFEWHINDALIKSAKNNISIMTFIIQTGKPFEDSLILADKSDDKYKIKYKLKSSFIA